MGNNISDRLPELSKWITYIIDTYTVSLSISWCDAGRKVMETEIVEIETIWRIYAKFYHAIMPITDQRNTIMPYSTVLNPKVNPMMHFLNKAYT